MNSHLQNSLRYAAVGAAVLIGGALFSAATPARAMDTDWHQACSFKTSPQGYGDMARERACIRQNDCVAMADAHGGMMTGMGCFGVAPDTPAAAASAAQPGRRR